jgi:hypothetical protein
MPTHGGKRKNAGRKEEVTLMTKMQITINVADTQRKYPHFSESRALQQLEIEGKLPDSQTKNNNSAKKKTSLASRYKRYLTPKELPPKIKSVLKKTERTGIVSTIPTDIQRGPKPK